MPRPGVRQGIAFSGMALTSRLGLYALSGQTQLGGRTPMAISWKLARQPGLVHLSDVRAPVQADVREGST